MENLLIAHGGAPTAVINASLYGVIKTLREQGFKGKILAARFGSKGILNEDFIDLTDISEGELSRLKTTPGSSIGTSRHPLEKCDYDKMLEIFARHNIKYVLFNGGNGSMDTLGNIYNAANDKGIIAVGIPKTIDNDIMETDHAPGYASAARYIASVVRDASCDVSGLPIHISVIESMGRNTGWITAAAALGRSGNGINPSLLYFPEIPFDEADFLTRSEKLFKTYGGAIIVASEGLKYKSGEPIVEPIFKVGRATYFGDVGSHLCNLIIKNLGIKARSEKPGLLGRCSSTLASAVDIEEAVLCGKEAVIAALSNISGVMIGIERVSNNPYQVKTKLVPIAKVMLAERTFPTQFIDQSGHFVTDEFINWAKPLVGELPDFVDFTSK